MASNEEEDRRRAEKARQVGLFRYALIQDLLDPALTTRERGRLARELAEQEHTDPFGRQVKVSRGTIDRWTRDYRGGGFAALVPEPRKAVPRTPPEVLELAAALKRENPGRTAAQIQRILRTTQGWSPTERTLQRHFVNAGLTGTSGGETSVFGRFEATRGNELWTGDALCRVAHNASYADLRVMPMSSPEAIRPQGCSSSQIGIITTIHVVLSSLHLRREDDHHGRPVEGPDIGSACCPRGRIRGRPGPARLRDQLGRIAPAPGRACEPMARPTGLGLQFVDLGIGRRVPGSSAGHWPCHSLVTAGAGPAACLPSGGRRGTARTGAVPGRCRRRRTRPLCPLPRRGAGTGRDDNRALRGSGPAVPVWP
ncbi:helix-turn-helix domain-containing protein [Streptomyces sp. NPDC001118]